MRRIATLLAAVVVAVGAAGSAPASAQVPNCFDLYNRAMMLYQTAPQSLEYNQVTAVYSATCLAGPAPAPAYPGPYPYYAQPAPVDPGAAIMGGIIGGLMGGAFEGDHNRRRDGDWRRREGDHDRRGNREQRRGGEHRRDGDWQHR